MYFLIVFAENFLFHLQGNMIFNVLNNQQKTAYSFLIFSKKSDNESC